MHAMLTSFVFLAILSSVVMEMNLRSFNFDGRWNDDLKFWGRTICRTGRRRSISLYESSRSNSSRRLYDFFGNLVTLAQTECGATLKTTKSYFTIDDKHSPMYFRRPFIEGERSITEGLPEILNDTDDDASRRSGSDLYLFPYSDVEIVVSMIEDCTQILMGGNIFNNWHNRRHVLVMVMSQLHEASEIGEESVKIITLVLKRLWRERRILNVFFAIPLSFSGRRLWFYDPFFKNGTSGVRGKIYTRAVSQIPYVERVKDLKGYTLNIGMFTAPPAAIKYDSNSIGIFPFTEKSLQYVGMDGLTMATVANRMNFAFNIIPPSDGHEFGFVCENGTFVGTIGDAAYHRIDIGFNSMYMKMYTSHEMETNVIKFTVPIDFDRLCVVVPRAEKVPRWLRTFYYFHPAIWMCLMLSQILVSLVWYLLRNFHGQSTGSKGQDGRYHSILVDTFLLFIGAPVKLNPSQAEKWFLSAVLLFGVTVMGTFAGTLYHSFTSEMRYKELSSLKEVDASGIDIGTTSPNLQDVFGLDGTIDDLEEVMSLRRKFKVIPYYNVSTIEKTAYHRNIASLSREKSFRVLKHRYVDNNGDRLLHLVRECPRTYYLSYVVPKDSIYIERLNDVITQLREAGLPTLWNSFTTNKLITAEIAAVNRRIVKSLDTPFNIHDMQTSFLLLLMGYFISLCVLFGEMICHKRQTYIRTRA